TVMKVLTNDTYFPPKAGDWGQAFADQWPLQKLDIPNAWTISQGQGVVVAVIDTGVDYTHPDIATNVIKGHNFVSGTEDPMDDNGHGTHVAGTIAAIANNGIGIAGVAPSSKILAIKILDSNGSGYFSDAASAIMYAVDSGAKVISM